MSAAWRAAAADWTRDWLLKLFSLGVAVALFWFVRSENTSSVEVDFRLEVRTGSDMMFVREPPALLHATLRGPGATFRSLDISDLKPVVLNLRAAEPGTLRQAIDIAAIIPPAGMKVVSVRPAEVEISLDRRVERQVPIRPDFSDGPAPGFEIIDVHLTPARAQVVGPAGKMQGLESIVTRPIDVGGREEDLRVEVDLRPPLSPLKLIDRRVVALIEIGEEFVQRSFSEVPVRIEGAARSWQLVTDQVALTIKGPRRALDNLDRDALEAMVRLPEVDPPGLTRMEKMVQLGGLPDRVQVVAPIPKVTLERTAVRRPRRRP